MPDYPILLPDFTFREPDDESDVKTIQNIQAFGWEIVGIPDDAESAGFCYTTGVYLRTLQPEILIMGLRMESSQAILNGIATYLLQGGTLLPDERYPDFIDSFDVIFRPIAPSHYREYLGYALWLYRSPFPALQCLWPDMEGNFPDDPDFNPSLRARQIDLSHPVS